LVMKTIFSMNSESLIERMDRCLFKTHSFNQSLCKSSSILRYLTIFVKFQIFLKCYETKSKKNSQVKIFHVQNFWLIWKWKLEKIMSGCIKIRSYEKQVKISCFVLFLILLKKIRIRIDFIYYFRKLLIYHLSALFFCRYRL
jgi:hypothetical protein